MPRREQEYTRLLLIATVTFASPMGMFFGVKFPFNFFWMQFECNMIRSPFLPIRKILACIFVGYSLQCSWLRCLTEGPSCKLNTTWRPAFERSLMLPWEVSRH